MDIEEFRRITADEEEGYPAEVAAMLACAAKFDRHNRPDTEEATGDCV